MTRRPGGTALGAAAWAHPALADPTEPSKVVVRCQAPEPAPAARETTEQVNVKKDTP
jgi:hypothetical protein